MEECTKAMYHGNQMPAREPVLVNHFESDSSDESDMDVNVTMPNVSSIPPRDSVPSPKSPRQIKTPSDQHKHHSLFRKANTSTEKPKRQASGIPPEVHV